MNKKLKRILATVSAVAMCATSVVSMNVGARYTESEITSDTVEFYVGDKKYVLNENAEYCFGIDKYSALEGAHLYTTEYAADPNYPTMPNLEVLCSDDSGGLSQFVNMGYCFCDNNDPNYGEEYGNIFSNYLADNNIEYYMESIMKDGDISCVGFMIEFPEGTRTSEKYEVYAKIKEDTGFECQWIIFCSGVGIPTDIKNTLPEPILSGDANEDGDVNMADAVLIMQTLSNPDDYKLTPQGMANADIAGDGDGVTAMDALTIQLSILNQ